MIVVPARSGWKSDCNRACAIERSLNRRRQSSLAKEKCVIADYTERALDRGNAHCSTIFCACAHAATADVPNWTPSELDTHLDELLMDWTPLRSWRRRVRIARVGVQTLSNRSSEPRVSLRFSRYRSGCSSGRFVRYRPCGCPIPGPSSSSVGVQFLGVNDVPGLNPVRAPRPES